MKFNMQNKEKTWRLEYTKNNIKKNQVIFSDDINELKLFLSKILKTNNHGFIFKNQLKG